MAQRVAVDRYRAKLRRQRARRRLLRPESPGANHQIEARVEVSQALSRLDYWERPVVSLNAPGLEASEVGRILNQPHLGLEARG